MNRKGLIRTGAMFSSIMLATTVAVTAGASTHAHSTPVATKNAAAAALVPSSYKGKTLIAATDASYPPDEFISTDGSTIVGFDIDLIKAIGTTLGVPVQSQNISFDTILGGIQSGQYDIGNSSFTDTKTREASVNFVDYFTAGEAFYVKSATKTSFTTLASLCGYKVSVEAGTTEEADAQAQAPKCPSNKHLTIHSYQDQNSANTAILSGQDNVGFVDSQVAGYIVAQSNKQFKLSGKPFAIAPYGITTAKTTAGLGFAKAIQAAVKVLIGNGVYKAILTKWGVAAGSVTAAKVTLNGAKS